MAKQKTNNGNAANLGFEAELFKAADKLRGNMEPSDYKHVALGLIFLKYISDAFEARHAELLAEDPRAAEDKDERSEEHTSELQSRGHLVCRLLLEKKKRTMN